MEASKVGLEHVTRKRGDEAKDPVLNAEGAGAKPVSDDLGSAVLTEESLMGSAKDADWSRTGTIVIYAEWLRKISGAFAVIIVRRDDAALASDPEIAPMDVKDLVCDRAERLVHDLAAARREKRKAARLELGPWRE